MVIIKNRKSGWWEEEMKTANTNEKHHTPKITHTHIYTMKSCWFSMIHLTAKKKREIKAILLIGYELADSDSGNVESSMAKVSIEEEEPVALTVVSSVSQCPRKDCWVVMFALDKALPIQNLVVVV